MNSSQISIYLFALNKWALVKCVQCICVRCIYSGHRVRSIDNQADCTNQRRHTMYLYVERIRDFFGLCAIQIYFLLTYLLTRHIYRRHLYQTVYTLIIIIRKHAQQSSVSELYPLCCRHSPESLADYLVS